VAWFIIGPGGKGRLLFFGQNRLAVCRQQAVMYDSACDLDITHHDGDSWFDGVAAFEIITSMTQRKHEIACKSSLERFRFPMYTLTRLEAYHKKSMSDRFSSWMKP
jgi:hypothetical protein